mmetsp:Transcript_28103/g.39668  ORF Transcript_28103/g.39668 Transcript_28103/m.39668 type:complete len:132 (+) Transcript_28103:51-446(+)
MTDSDRISLKCDVVVDHLTQARKNSRPRKECRLVFDRDDYGNILLIVDPKSKSNRLIFKIEDNIVRLYSDFQSKGKGSIELEVPHVLLLISNANEVEMKSFFQILYQIKDHPETAHQLELWREEDLQQDKA